MSCIVGLGKARVLTLPPPHLILPQPPLSNGLPPQSTTNTYTISGAPVDGVEYGVLVGYQDNRVGSDLSFTPRHSLSVKNSGHQATAGASMKMALA